MESGETAPEAEAGESSDSGLPRNFLLKAILICLAGIVWIVLGIGKVLLYSVAALLFVAISLVELVGELIAMPIVLLLRLLGAARWPVQINRHGKTFRYQVRGRLRRGHGIVRRGGRPDRAGKSDVGGACSRGVNHDRPRWQDSIQPKVGRFEP
ncbi:MAG: hypothetical protein QOF25_1969 [Mycobacterium sp.]|nr:hypothetical protein [Mycobacterium sp.]